MGKQSRAPGRNGITRDSDRYGPKFSFIGMLPFGSFSLWTVASLNYLHLPAERSSCSNKLLGGHAEEDSRSQGR